MSALTGTENKSEFNPQTGSTSNNMSKANGRSWSILDPFIQFFSLIGEIFSAIFSLFLPSSKNEEIELKPLVHKSLISSPKQKKEKLTVHTPILSNAELEHEKFAEIENWKNDFMKFLELKNANFKINPKFIEKIIPQLKAAQNWRDQQSPKVKNFTSIDIFLKALAALENYPELLPKG